ncbi:MAG: thioredoxin domain-containing protein [Actinomycetia bacterium]|nr:thioredoxin domain-containing protein [Actinomycetes bacterium]
MPNRLADATSPYLLQHKDNPVDWYEWGEEAFVEARDRDIPVILSVGYSSCHWCHVMAHESFEDGVTADFMNEHFVNVKVDREERPDVDRIYMDAVQAMTGRGGWPMTVFLTPDAKPIFAGTYYPRVAMAGHPSFMDVMTSVLDAWVNNREGAIDQADHITSTITQRNPAPAHLPTLGQLDQAVTSLSQMFDRTNGGFGTAPKFPQAPTLEFLLRMAALRPDTDEGRSAAAMLTQMLTAMADGGIYDHLLGGFARYSVDAGWLIPHFEKMLYDNALLARLYLRAWQVTGIERFNEVARGVLDYLEVTMVDATGALHSAEDADSEGVEGKFAVWTWEELGTVLGDDRDLAAAIYGPTPRGNFEGANNLHRLTDIGAVSSATGLTISELHHARSRIDERLRAARAERVPPGRDDKIVTAWNGLAMRAFAEAGAVLDEPRYTDRAIAIADFLLTEASPDGHLVRSWRERPGHPAFADDLAATAIGLYTLFSATGDEYWFTSAESMVGLLRERFPDPDGGFFATSADAGDLLMRPRNTQDSPTPSDNSLALEALQLHIALTGDLEAVGEFEATMSSLAADALTHPAFGGYGLAVWLTHLVGVKEVAIVGTPEQRATLTHPVWGEFRPNVVLAVGDGSPSTVPLLADRTAGDGGLAYVCRGLTCDLPVSTPEALTTKL